MVFTINELVVYNLCIYSFVICLCECYSKLFGSKKTMDHGDYVKR